MKTSHFQMVFSRKIQRGEKIKKNTVPQEDYDGDAERNPTMFSVLHSSSF